MPNIVGRPRSDTADGELLAKILRGAWRRAPPPVDFSEEELAASLGALDRWYLNGVAWWRIRQSPLARTASGMRVRANYVSQSVLGAAGTHRVFRYISALREQGVEAIVFKGWALVPYYAEPGLRSMGDVDLAVEPERAPLAVAILERLGARAHEMDVHPGLSDPAHAAFIPHSNWDELLARSRTRMLGGQKICLLSAEDELQLVCIHCMRHLAARPIWLCDIAATVESAPASMDWERCLSRPPYRSWILYAVLLAHHLLDADLGATPFAGERTRLPPWLIEDVLRRWSRPPDPSIAVHDSIFRIWREPNRWKQAVRVRVPNRLAATLSYHRSLDERFLTRYQARVLWDNLARFARRNLAGQPEDISENNGPPV